MKLLRDFMRLCIAGYQFLPDRRAKTRRSWTITVPAPRDNSIESMAVDMHWNADPAKGRPIAHWHAHVPPQPPGHLQLISSC